MKPETAYRVQRLAYFAMCGFMVAFARTFFPTSPGMAHRHVTVFALLGMYFVMGAALPGMRERISATPAAIRVILAVCVALPLLVLGFRILSFSLGTVAVFSLQWATGVVAADGLVFIVLLSVSVVRKNLRGASRFIFFLALFLNAMLLVPVSMAAWHPPATSECEACLDSEFVSAVTPLDAGETLSTPYDVLYIPEKQLLAISFKMIGNHMFRRWDRPEANRLVVLDVSDPADIRSAEVPLNELMLPECLEWNPDDGLLYVTKVGNGVHKITAVRITGFPELKIAWEKEIPFEPNGIVYDTETRALVVTGIEGAVSFRNPVTFEETAAITIPVSAGVNSIDTYLPPGSRNIYMAMIGRKVTVINLDSRELSFNDAFFGGGQFAGAEGASGILQTDLLFNSLNILNAKLGLVKRIELGYKPRPIVVDDERGKILIGEWPGGEIHFHQAMRADLAEARPPVRVGRYPRNFAYDSERGILYSASLCGVYAVDVAGALQDAKENR